ncbi:MAG: hypothetical protein WCU88_00490 [Elusimicrobiota bacterium]
MEEPTMAIAPLNLLRSSALKEFESSFQAGMRAMPKTSCSISIVSPLASTVFPMTLFVFPRILILIQFGKRSK